MAAQIGKNILLIEQFSFLSFLYSWLHQKRFNKIYCVNTSLFGNLLLKLIKKAGIYSDKTELLQYADLPGSFFVAEKEGYEYGIDTFFDHYSDNLYVLLAKRFCQNDLCYCAIKKELYNRYLEKRIKTFTFLKILQSEKSGGELFFIPIDNEDIPSFLSPAFRQMERGTIPASITIIYYLTQKCRQYLLIPVFPVLLVLVAGKMLRRGITLKNTTQVYTYAIDMYNYGLNFKKGYDYHYIFDFKDLHPKKILHVVRNKFEDSENGRRTAEYLTRKKYPWIEFDNISIPSVLFYRRILIDFVCKNIVGLFRFLFSANTRVCLMIPSIAVMKMMIDAEIFYTQYTVKLFIGRDEYSPFHIMRTIVARSFGGKTIGFAHGDDCVYTNAWNYVVCDKYGAWGEFYKEFLKKSMQFSDVEIIGGGVFGLDKTYEFIKKSKIPARYKNIKKTSRIILICASTFASYEYANKKMTIEFFRDVLAATDCYYDAIRIIKPKGEELNDPDIQAVLQSHPRVIVDESTWIYRLLPISDLIITINTTTVGIEGLIAGIKVHYYDVSNCRPFSIYAQYADLLVSSDYAELKRKIDLILNQGCYIDTEIIDKIRVLHGYRFDGSVIQRLRKICSEMVS